MTQPLSSLPIDALLPDILTSLARVPRLVLSAPPGSGKTTRLPRAMLDAGLPATGEIIVLEPRRIAARMAARRVAEELGEQLGERVGLTVRFENLSSPRTRIRFVTEGVLTQYLLNGNDLAGVSAVLLDEFHERHLQTDLALALLRELSRTRRPELLLVAMSATLATDALAAFLGAPVIEGGGRLFPVAVDFINIPDERPLAARVASGVRRALDETGSGDVLVFLPGAGEITRARDACAGVAQEKGASVWTLHGEMSAEEQDAAVAASSARKIILSTNVAESSVTIPGVRAVVDSGLARTVTMSPWTGFNELRTGPISQASAIQRSGRAGRTQPGFALRLYPKVDFDRRAPHDLPEIARVDLAELALTLRAKGHDPLKFPYFEEPPLPALEAAMDLLDRLGATSHGAVTGLGERLLRLPLHPRLGRFLLFAHDAGASTSGATIAALLAERPIRRGRTQHGGARRQATLSHDSDPIARLAEFEELRVAGFSSWVLREGGFDHGAVRTVQQSARQLCRELRGRGGDVENDTVLRQALLAGYGDRVARRRKAGSKELVLSSGGTALQGDESEVHDAPFVLVLSVAEGLARKVGSAAQAVTATMLSAIEPEWLLEQFPDRIREDRQVTFVPGKDRVEITERLLYDAVVLDETTKKGPPDDEEVARELARAALAKGLGAFANEPAQVERFLDRARFVATIDPTFPSFEGATLERLMTEVCRGKTSFAELRDGSLGYALEATLSKPQRTQLNEWAPESLALASGRRVSVQYPPGQTPFAESRLQDFFGWARTPMLAANRVALLLHLLAPNKRAVQVTTDLAGFWERHYPTVKRELARKYPRHSWPDDPTKPEPPMRPRQPRRDPA